MHCPLMYMSALSGGLSGACCVPVCVHLRPEASGHWGPTPSGCGLRSPSASRPAGPRCRCSNPQFCDNSNEHCEPLIFRDKSRFHLSFMKFTKFHFRISDQAYFYLAGSVGKSEERRGGMQISRDFGRCAASCLGIIWLKIRNDYVQEMSARMGFLTRRFWGRSPDVLRHKVLKSTILRNFKKSRGYTARISYV